jgi:hypothetical protein
MIENIKRGDIIQFYTSCNADRKLFTGEVAYRYQYGFITVVDGVEYELNKLVDIKLLNTNTMQNYSEYQFFLFTQLFNVTIDTTDVPYDILYSIVKDSWVKFSGSIYNDPNEPEYECMVDFLNAHSDVISITICDHVNL